MAKDVPFPGQGRGNTVFFNYLFLCLLALVYIFPFILQVATSFKTDAEATSAGMKVWSDNWTTAAYQTLFNNGINDAAARATLGNRKATLRVQAHP